MKKLLVLFLCLFSIDSHSTGIGAVSSAPCDNDTLSKYSGTVNAEINWEPNVIGLSWYDGNKLIDGPATCTYDGTITVPATPTKLGYTFNGWKVIPLNIPNGYTKLEYIESDGNQYINTGVLQHFKQRTTFEIAFNPSKLGNSGVWMGGNAYTQIRISESNGFSVGNVSVVKVIYDNDSTEKIYNNGVLKTSASWGSGWDNLPILLFALGMNFGANPADNGIRSPGKLYYAKIYNENDETVRYFVPVRRNSDNVLGMWDTVTQTFFTNSGTGNFVAGPVAP